MADQLKKAEAMLAANLHLMAVPVDGERWLHRDGRIVDATVAAEANAIPTHEQALAMFDANASLASVQIQDGTWVHRGGYTSKCRNPAEDAFL